MGIVVSQVMPFPFSLTTPISREYLAACSAPVATTSPTTRAWKAMSPPRCSSRDCARAGKAPSRDALINALETVQSLDLGGFVGRLHGRGHVASRFVDLSMLTDDGRVRV